MIGAELIYMDMSRMIRLDVDIWPYENRIAFLKRKLKAVITTDIPPILTDPSQTWQCGYCPVSATCEGLTQIDKVFDEDKALAALGF